MLHFQAQVPVQCWFEDHNVALWFGLFVLPQEKSDQTNTAAEILILSSEGSLTPLFSEAGRKNASEREGN